MVRFRGVERALYPLTFKGCSLTTEGTGRFTVNALNLKAFVAYPHFNTSFVKGSVLRFRP